MEGFIPVNKPENMTSFDCLMQIKRQLNIRVKIGHAGTLDAFASGLLIVAFGRSATACIKELMVLDKRYRATAHTGIQTDTLDRTGIIIKKSNCIPSVEQLSSTMFSLMPGYWQVPPIFSALKYKGDRLSDLQRKDATTIPLDKIAESKVNLISLYSLELCSYDSLSFSLEAHVSHGTYIRSLVRDIAKKANTCATVTHLVRSAIGPFILDEAHTLTALTLEYVKTHIISVEHMREMIKQYEQKTNRARKQAELLDYKKRRGLQYID